MTNGPFNFNEVYNIPPGGFIITKFLQKLFDVLTGHNHDGVNSCLTPAQAASAASALAAAGSATAAAASAASVSTYSAVVTVTDADWTAGKTLIAGVAGKKIVPLSVKSISTAALTCTATASVFLKDTTGAPVTLLTLLVANLAGGNAILKDGATGYTPTAPFLTGVATGKGIVIPAVADVTSTGSSTTFLISYALV